MSAQLFIPRVVLAAVVGLGVTSSASAATWIGPATGADWHVPENWDTGTVPGAGDTAIFTYNTTFTSFDGATIGVIDSTGFNITFSASHTLTFDNGLDTPAIRSARLTFGSGTSPTFVFNDTLIIQASSEMTTREGIFEGGKLVVNNTDWGWVTGSGLVLNVDHLDMSGSTKPLRAGSGSHALPTLAGVIVDLGNMVKLVADWPDSATFAGLNGSHLRMAGSYALFGNVPTGGENLELASWTVGSTVLEPGTYDINSEAIGDANFALIFSGTGSSMSITVVPEPVSLGLMGMAGVVLLSRRRMG